MLTPEVIEVLSHLVISLLSALLFPFPSLSLSPFFLFDHGEEGEIIWKGKGIRGHRVETASGRY